MHGVDWTSANGGGYGIEGERDVEGKMMMGCVKQM